MWLGCTIGFFLSLIIAPAICLLLGLSSDWIVPLMGFVTVASGAALNRIFWID